MLTDLVNVFSLFRIFIHTTSELRLMIVKALRDAWTEVVENKKTIYRAFEKTRISLKTKQMDPKTARKCTFKDSQWAFLRTLYIHEFNFWYLIVEWDFCLYTLFFRQFAAIWQCRYLTKKFVKNFARRPSQSFFLPLFDSAAIWQKTVYSHWNLES